MSYSVLTPYLIPPELEPYKAANIGDGFILHALQKLLQPFSCQHLFTSRRQLRPIEIDRINRTKALILAGANQLNDRFTVLPQTNLEQLKKIEVPIVPFAIGIHGVPRYNTQMSAATESILREIHSRLGYSSWRCNLSLAYLHQFLPDLKDKFLMTGCPVMYDRKILSGVQFSNRERKIVVTVTDREDFWQREIETINFVSSRFPSSRKFLSLHQDFHALKIKSKTSNMWQRIGLQLSGKISTKFLQIREYAREKGFTIFKPKSVTNCLRFYQDCDLHIGSRLHAHLYFLSQAKKSFVTYVDDRCTGFAKTFDFPICDPHHLEKYLEYDFEIYRQNCIKGHENMARFITYLKEEILS